MALATVLIPTFEHAECLRHSIGSVLEQTMQDFEVLVVGDGAAGGIRRVVDEMGARDKRIRFFDFPKGERKGERHRHEALQHATGRFVAYLGDDDVWMPNHLAALVGLLQNADFGHTLHIGINADGTWIIFPADLENPGFRQRMLTQPFNCFDLTFGGHTLAAYRRLPGGWAPPPPDCPWSDLYMWRQFLAEPWCRARSLMEPTGICTHTHLRPHLTDGQRAEELARLRAEFANPAFREGLWKDAASLFARTAIRNDRANE